ncbi:MAG: N-acetylmuramoyl-L-alanine amidase [Clostridiales bacterium]|jgi:N-acetylmuramoyl-L-alanine amidase|nr:N-acetylmuramoyl-L-alanine amidase [Clostridiales bacterium]
MERSPLVLVIDPGHGGADGGANVGNVFESSLNLSIALKLDSIMGLFAVPTVLTRTGEDIEYPPEANTIRAKKVFDTKRRVKLIESIPNSVLISIHQNKFPDDYPHGAQSFYSRNPGSEELAKNTQKLLVKILDPQNKREAREIYSGVYLMKSVSCPSILVECGFLSNPRELALLQTEEYQTKTAVCLSAAFLNTCDILEEVNGKG